jgi:hypothetical protein
MVKSEMLMLIKREMTDMIDTDMAIDWMLYTTTKTLLSEIERKNMAWRRLRYSLANIGTSLNGMKQVVAWGCS